MKKFKLTLSYDGTAYHGWQSQRSGMGVQDAVEKALAGIFSSAPKLQGASRTDAGVHAYGMVAHFQIPCAELKMPDRHLLLAINARLPDDIRVRKTVVVQDSFHARFDTTGKQYRYLIWNHAAMNPLLRTQAWHVPQKLNLAAMEEAAEYFTGRKDFRAFTAKRDGILGDSVRTLTRCEIKKSGSKLTFIIEGEGFLYKMCRGIVGTLIQIGYGKYPPDAVLRMFSGKDRAMAGMNAPAHGLILWKVFYQK